MIKKMDIRLYGIRHFSSSLMQLSREMDDVYEMLCKKSNYKVSREQLSHIQHKIFNHYYVLKPLRMLNINILDVKSVFKEVAVDYPDISIERINVGSAPEKYSVIVVLPSNQGDSLIFLALSAMLLRLTHGSSYDGVFRLDYGLNAFYESIKGMRNVDRVYHLDLTESLTKIPISLILDRVSSLVGEGTGVYKLIKSFLDIEIIDSSGNSMNKIDKEGLPPAGELTRVLFDIVLKDIFDRNFEQRFPGVAFSRFREDVLIYGTQYVQYSNLNENALRDLLKELNLQGRVCSIEPGGKFLLSKKIAVLSTAREVILYDPFVTL